MYKKRGCWYLVAPEPFGDGVRDLEECSGRVSEEGAARTYCLSRRTWTLLALSVPVGEGRVKGSGMAGVPSQREGTGQEKKEQAGRPGFPRNGRERARKKRGKAGKPGFPRNGRERARNKGRKQESRAPARRKNGIFLPPGAFLSNFVTHPSFFGKGGSRSVAPSKGFSSRRGGVGRRASFSGGLSPGGFLAAAVRSETVNSILISSLETQNWILPERWY
ncbi:hypothetical protein GEV33_004784 [Tenebrio molitor]|uniref:Uncharacterized protein n=1 Tax=Tenebrio molitor TaxID=7067 RepID=A0A8J6HPH3_TENMO|nr:hypothetical protein GEV33_004784 [Tenebrio molitor]